MGTAIEVLKNGQNTALTFSDGCVLISGVKAGDVVEVRHTLQTRVSHELIQEKDYTVYWRAADVIKIEPEGDHLRLYQRELGVEKVYPPRSGSNAAVSLAPTEQKK